MARVVFPSLLLVALNLCLFLHSSTPAFAARSHHAGKITSMLPENKVPPEAMKKICSKTKDPQFCNKFAEGDMQTLLTTSDEGRLKVLNTAIDIVSICEEQISSSLKDKKINREEKSVVRTCLARYRKVTVSLKESATTGDSKKLGHDLQVAGEALWQCEVALQSVKASHVTREIRVTNSLTNFFVSYVQSEFYAHIVTGY